MRTGFLALSRALTGALVILSSSAALAIPISLQVYADGVLIGNVDENVLGCVDVIPGVSATCNATNLDYGDGYTQFQIDSLSMTIDADPVVTGTWAVTNTDFLNPTQHFTMVFTLPIAPPIPGPTLSGGSISGTVSDGDGNGATLSAFGGSSIYTAQIDGSNTATLYDDPTSISALPFDTAAISEAIFGAPVPNQLGGPALVSIGIVLDFVLTQFDSATFTSEHEVIPVPEPRTAALLAIGCALLAGARRRR
jgi:hypothetical protein